MSHPVDNDRISQFRKDRKILPYDDVVIAEKMGKDKSSYSKSVNEGPITNAFLKKFYAAFGNELDEIQGNRQGGNKHTPGSDDVPTELHENIRATYSEILQVKMKVESLEKKLERIEGLLDVLRRMGENNCD